MDDEETVAITVDISNCFNSTRRAQIFQELIKYNMQAELGVTKSMLGYPNSVYHVNPKSQITTTMAYTREIQLARLA